MYAAGRKDVQMSGWETNVRKVTPYIPGEQPDDADMIKLNTNENPYPPSPSASAVLGGMNGGRMRLYPDPDVRELKAALSGHFGIEPGQVFVGVGSDDVLATAFLTFFNGKKPVLFPDVTYSFYEVWAELFGIPYERPMLDEDFRIKKEDYLRENGGIVFPNPNAPTGVEMPLTDIEEIIAGNPGSVVIVDEAYVDFGAQSALPLIDKYDNLLVVQTFSKSRSMAGMRIGYAMGSKRLIGFLNDVRNSFNSYTMNRPAIAMGTAAVRDDDYFRMICQKIIDTRENTAVQLRRLGFHFEESKANFIFAAHRSVPAADLMQELRKRHIYVRYFPKGRTQNYLRITIGTPEQMERLFAALKEILGEEQA